MEVEGVQSNTSLTDPRTKVEAGKRGWEYCPVAPGSVIFPVLHLSSQLVLRNQHLTVVSWCVLQQVQSWILIQMVFIPEC